MSDGIHQYKFVETIMDVGVIGVGAMGKNHARIYSELKAVDSLSIFDLT